MSAAPLQAVITDQAPAPVGPYNQAVKANGWLYCSGQIPLDPASGTMVGGGDVEQFILADVTETGEAVARDPAMRPRVLEQDRAELAAATRLYTRPKAHARPLAPTVTAAGVVKPAPSSTAVVAAPVEGLVAWSDQLPAVDAVEADIRAVGRPLTDAWAPVEALQARVFVQGLTWR